MDYQYIVNGAQRDIEQLGLPGFIKLYQLDYLTAGLEARCPGHKYTKVGVSRNTSVNGHAIRAYKLKSDHQVAVVCRPAEALALTGYGQEFPACCGAAFFHSFCSDNTGYIDGKYVPQDNGIYTLFEYFELYFSNLVTEATYIATRDQFEIVEALKKRDWYPGHTFINNNSGKQCTYWHKELNVK